MKIKHILWLTITAVILSIGAGILTSCNINPFFGIGNADAVAPSVYIVYPLEGSILVPGNINIRGTAGDNEELTEVYVLVDGVQIGTGGSASEWQIQWPASSASLGEHTITAVSMDKSGNRATNSIDILLDFGGPSVTIIAPVTNANISGNYIFQGTAADDNSIISVQMSFDAQNWYDIPFANAGTTNVTWSTNIPTTNLTEGLNYVYIKALDISSNLSTTYSYFFVLNTSASVDILSPTDGSVVGGTVNIVATVSGVFIENVYLRFNSGSWTNLGAVYSINVPWNTTAYSNTVDVELMIVNRGGMTNSNSVNVTIDQTVPVISINSPTNYSYVNGTVTVSGTAADDYSLKGISLSTNNGITYSVTVDYPIYSKTNSWSYDIDTTQFENGVHNFWFKVEDMEDKAQTTVLQLNVENSIPTINISSPQLQADGTTTILESYVVSGSVSSTYVPDSVSMRINDGMWFTLDVNEFSWRYTLAFTPADPVTNDIDIVVTNKVGVVAMTNFTLIVDKELPTADIDYPQAGDYLSGITPPTTFTATGYAHDDTAVDRVYVSFNDFNTFTNATVNAPVNGTNSWTLNYNAANLSGGSTYMSVKVYDKAGKSYTAGVDLRCG